MMIMMKKQKKPNAKYSGMHKYMDPLLKSVLCYLQDLQPVSVFQTHCALLEYEVLLKRKGTNRKRDKTG